jgi:DNA-3-methyladenine glycosylase I
MTMGETVSLERTNPESANPESASPWGAAGEPAGAVAVGPAGPAGPIGPIGDARADAPATDDGGPRPGPDGRPRCPWAVGTADYVVYHDEEWGRPVRDTVGLFERLSLEAFQSGLSWLTILRKRDGFRRAFADFDPAAVARFGPADVERLLADASIVRNRQKIDATIANARAIVNLERPLPELIWSLRPPPGPPPRTVRDVPARTPASVALAKALRAHGLVFVGPTTGYALMQACGLVDDHLAGCFVRTELPAS